MQKLAWLVLLAGGVALLFCGVNASDSTGSFFSRIITGSPSYKTIGLLIGGLVCTLAGLAGVLRSAGS
jgi:hypothetical protein